jgi:hypothetical protein
LTTRRRERTILVAVAIRSRYPNTEVVMPNNAAAILNFVRWYYGSENEFPTLDQINEFLAELVERWAEYRDSTEDAAVKALLSTYDEEGGF